MGKPADIFKLVYVSTATKLYSIEELSDLLKLARSNNQKLGISGLMLYGNGVFIQLLEGEKEAVENLFNKISLDKNHHGIIVLSKEMGEERDFPDWSMGFQRFKHELDLDAINGFSEIAENEQAYSAVLENVSTKVKLLVNTFKRTSGLQRYH